MPPLEIAKETLPQLIRRALATPRDAAIVERVRGNWTPTSAAALLERVENVACAIRDAGLVPGDRVALIARDCTDWIACDFAVLFAGCVVVPVFPTQAVDHTEFILTHSGAKLLFVDSAKGLDRLTDGDIAVPPTIVFESSGADSLASFERRGAAIRGAHPEFPSAYEALLQPDDLAVLIYTSGTTGNPKGVMLTHDNLAFDARSALESALEKIYPGDDVLSVLPFSHIYEHTMVFIYLLSEVRYHLCHDPADLLRDMLDVRPVCMTCVPRIFDRMLAGVIGQAMKHGGLQAKIVPWALRTARDYARAQVLRSGANAALAIKYALAKRLVLKKIRARLGLDRLRYFTSGSAALHIDVAMTYHGLGIPIMQGYGLTETSPVITVNRPSTNRYGTVGPPIPGVEVQIAPDGEVLTRGRNVMRGYYNEPEASAQALVDGWLHTGDIGEIDGDGFLRITDRKKEVFKTDTGKYVAPARVEAALKRSVFVAQAMVVGNERPHPAALITPNWDLVRLELKILPDVSKDQMVTRADVVGFMATEARRQTADLATYEQIRRIVLLAHEFSVESGELSPSMKIKRRVVEGRYAAEIDRAYAVDLHAQGDKER
ncbi:MAG: long-chain fatty acid--CoA ligase [Candidatus Baltobacteraceae bacterium]